MSHRKVCSVVAAATAALALAGGAYGDPGKNGPPGPAGNPNQPTSQPDANAPQGPAGNSGASADAKSGNQGTSADAHAKVKTHAKSEASHGSSGTHGTSVVAHAKTKSHGNSGSSHANTTPGTPRTGGREDRPAGKITICHATKSVKNPYVEITISMNGLHGHGPAEDPHHHAGSWKDIIPAPAGGCPSTVQQRGSSHQEHQSTPTPTSTTTTTSTTSTTKVAPEVTTPAPATAGQEVLGARAAGGTAPARDDDTASPGESKVLGARASGTAPAAALATRPSANRGGTLPFTGTDLAFVLLVAAVALLGGFALRRATASGRARA